MLISAMSQPRLSPRPRHLANNRLAFAGQQNRNPLPLCKSTMEDSVLAVEVASHYPQTERSWKMSERKTFDVGRDSRSGQFITVKEAISRPATTTVERIPKSGYGDTKGEPSRRK